MKIERVKVEMENESRLKAEEHSEWVSFKQVNCAKHRQEMVKAEKHTEEILAQKCSGNPSSKDTLVHVLAAMSTAHGKKCVFFDRSKGIDDSMGSSKTTFFAGDSTLSCSKNHLIYSESTL